MSELKTLKDLKRKEAEKYGMCDFCIAVAKQEGIKWVKNCEICPTSWPTKICSKHKELAKFHNITEEDLK